MLAKFFFILSLSVFLFCHPSVGQFTGESLRELLAREKNAPEIFIPSGTYNFTDLDSLSTHLLISGHTNQVIHATDVIIVGTRCDALASIVRFHLCENVTVIGLAVDCDPLMGTQGTIISVSGDYKQLEVAIDDGYRTDIFSDSHSSFPQLRPVKVYTSDGQDYVLRCGSFNVVNGGISHVNGNTSHWNIDVAQNGFDCFEVGQKLALVATTFHGVWVTFSKELTFEGTKVWGAGAMGFAMSGAWGDHTLRNIRVERRPGTNRLWSSNRDGIHNSEMHIGASLLDSYVGWTVDDGLNQHGFFGRVLEVDGSEFLYAGHDADHNPALLLDAPPSGYGLSQISYFLTDETSGAQLYDFATASVSREDTLPGFNTSLKDYAVAQGWCISSGACRVWRVSTQITGLSLSLGDGVILQSSACAGGVARGNFFDHNDGRCALVQWSDSIIEENYCVAPMSAGIVLSGQWYLTGPVMNSTIRNNVVVRAGMKNNFPGVGWSMVGSGHGIMSHLGDDVPSAVNPVNYAWMHSNMIIESNNISEPLNSGVYIYTGQGGSVIDNRICSLGTRLPPYSNVPQEAVVLGGNLGEPAEYNVEESGTVVQSEVCEEWDYSVDSSDDSDDPSGDGADEATGLQCWWLTTTK